MDQRTEKASHRVACPQLKILDALENMQKRDLPTLHPNSTDLGVPGASEAAPVLTTGKNRGLARGTAPLDCFGTAPGVEGAAAADD